MALRGYTRHSYRRAMVALVLLQIICYGIAGRWGGSRAAAASSEARLLALRQRWRCWTGCVWRNPARVRLIGANLGLTGEVHWSWFASTLQPTPTPPTCAMVSVVGWIRIQHHPGCQSFGDNSARDVLGPAKCRAGSIGSAGSPAGV